MKALSVLDEVVKTLEEHENAVRIKKLIYGVCKNSWENDINKLQSFRLKELIQELKILNPTFDYLKYSFNRVVQTLNKPTEYSLVADVIFEQIACLYADYQEATQPIALPKYYPTPPVASVPQQPTTFQPILGWDEPKQPYDLFELRLEIMKYTNPLRAKVLVFSTLYQKFDFNNEDWLIIKGNKLDDLLQKLFYACETLTDLEYHLHTIARYLKPADEYTQAAGAIVQAMKRYYANRQPGQYRSEEFEIDYGQQRSIGINPTNISDDDDDQTCQVRPSY